MTSRLRHHHFLYPFLKDHTGFQVTYVGGANIIERNNYHSPKAKKFLLSNWSLIDKKGLKVLRLWHKGDLRVELNTEFSMDSPPLDWFYVCKTVQDFNKRKIVARIIGCRRNNYFDLYKVLEDTGEIYKYQKETLNEIRRV